MLHQFKAEPADAGKRLDQFVVEKLESASRARVQELMERGRVRLNGAPAKASYRIRGGENVVVEWQPRPPLHAFPEDLALDILYEDADIVVVNKAAGMPVHAGAGRHAGTLVNALLHRYGNLSAVAGEVRPGIVHRLDRLTSGAMIVARNDEAHRALAAQFQGREVSKTYLALVHGHVAQEKGRIAAPIARDLVRRHRMTSRRVRGAREALSEYRVRQRFTRDGQKFTLLEVSIHTGRTHQIRVHLSSIGHPVVGDSLYGAPKGLLDRQFLHAWTLGLRHPRTGEALEFKAPLPDGLKEFLAML